MSSLPYQIVWLARLNFAYVKAFGNPLKPGQTVLHSLTKHIQAGQRKDDTIYKVMFRSWSGTGVCVFVVVCE